LGVNKISRNQCKAALDGFQVRPRAGCAFRQRLHNAAALLFATPVPVPAAAQRSTPALDPGTSRKKRSQQWEKPSREEAQQR
jgi:hypothetical protein